MRGLSGRDPLKPGTGMLFIFDDLSFQSMWMPEMRFPLDIIWLDENLSVVHITEGCPPCPDVRPENCPSYESKYRVKYAIEVVAGQAAIYGFTQGIKLSVAD